MSKPDTPGELRNVDVQFVSLVDKAANRRTFKVFKSADWNEDGESDPQPDQLRGLWQTLKAFFTGQKPVQKADSPPASLASVILAQTTEGDLDEARWALSDMMRQILEGDAPDKAARIGQAIDEYKQYVLNRLASVGVVKAREEVAKIGKKVSAARLGLLREAMNKLQEALADLEAKEDNNEGGEEQVTKEELEQAISEQVAKAVEPLAERVAKLETPEQKPEAQQVTAEKVSELVGAAVTKAVEPLAARVEKLEQARGTGNANPEPVAKSGSNEGIWGGLFL